MSDNLPTERQSFEQETYVYVTVRQVEGLILAHDPEIIQLAAEVGSRLPLMAVQEDQLIAVESLRDQIRARVVRRGDRTELS